MKYSLDSFDSSLYQYINGYEKIVIYGFGYLGKEFYKKYKDHIFIHAIIDQHIISKDVEVIKVSKLENLDNDALVINTVLNLIESVTIFHSIKKKFPYANIINCNNFLIESSEEKKTSMLASKLRNQGYLFEIGWIKSFENNSSLDKKGDPLPWVTYPFIDFIESRLNKTMTIFEFGSGNSTLWYSQRVKNVTSVENNTQWYNKILSYNIENIKIYYQKLEYGGKYCKLISTLQSRYDIVIVDGRDRVNSIRQSISFLSQDGIIVLDDSERDCYLDGINYLLERGFKRLDFWGIAPGIFFRKCTSIFYKNVNCLGI